MTYAVPDAIKYQYVKRTTNPGIPTEQDVTVFDALAFPPQSGVDAVAADLALAESVGVIDPPDGVLERAYQSRDWMRNFYDSASILSGYSVDGS
ncbi:hypothetical protein [Mycolicibacter kumamotonensis]|uniref:Uncharacterized protein n=1 Tax=Mycolicibacter kumamotonensis TaxID=354243 RepID=A0A1B8SL87_9MYCO|nr:hypothetical protein [Mycolicibacter kumamotonensis]OBY33526.1 hypothetical protein ACT18_00920 [Mycolicibacter kumamotonensis]